MKLVSYNVQYGIGRDGRFDLVRIADAVRGAEIIALQEVTRNFKRNDGADMVAGLADLLPEHFFVFAPAMDVDLGQRDAAGRPLNRRLEFGNMVLSRWPIAGARNLLLPRSRRLSRGNLQRAALEALVMAPQEALRVYSVHLDHISAEERAAQILHLKERVLAVPLEGGALSGAAEFGFAEPPAPEAFVLLGDFNMVQGSPEYRAMVGEPDPQEGLSLVFHHPVDAYGLGEAAPAGAVSWIDAAGGGRGRLIDYAFVHASLAERVVRCRVDGEAEGSDHQPVWLELS
ncbi:MAG: endonuclease/exonuclease/phosphatase family protein [Mesorhizobium sp.]